MAKTPVEIKGAGQPPAPQAPDLWRSLRSEMDRFFDRFTSGFAPAMLPRLFDWPAPFRFPRPEGELVPSVDVSEDESGYRITAEMAGMETKDVSVELTDDVLTVKGEKREEKERQEGKTHVAERAFGSFERSFAVPEDIDRAKITAEVAKGVLTVSLPKLPGMKKESRKIEIKAGPQA